MARRRPKPRRTWPERLFTVLGVTIAGLCIAVIYVLNLAQDKVSEVQRIAIGGDVLAEDVTTGEPRNILVVGIDSAEGLDPDDPRAVGRTDAILTDTMMIVRLDPISESASILSLPRDLWVNIGGQEQKLNAAMGLGGGPDGGGVPLLIETIEETFGIPINNYVQVDFNAFLGVVDAIDGVPYYFEYPVRDERSGLLIEEAGCQVVGPDDALAFVRARASFQQEIDGQWQLGLGSDLERIERQQAFVVAMANQAIAKGARNPVTLNSLINAAIDDVVLDTRLTFDELLNIGAQFQEFRTDNLDTLSFDGLFDIEPRPGISALGVTNTPNNHAIAEFFAGGNLETGLFADPTLDETNDIESSEPVEPDNSGTTEVEQPDQADDLDDPTAVDAETESVEAPLDGADEPTITC